MLERFALGAAKGNGKLFNMSMATGWFGLLTATVLNPGR
jgi:hypothetical protein